MSHHPSNITSNPYKERETVISPYFQNSYSSIAAKENRPVVVAEETKEIELENVGHKIQPFQCDITNRQIPTKKKMLSKKRVDLSNTPFQL